jgi:hypothetical protein
VNPRGTRGAPDNRTTPTTPPSNWSLVRLPKVRAWRSRRAPAARQVVPWSPLKAVGMVPILTAGNTFGAIGRSIRDVRSVAMRPWSFAQNPGAPMRCAAASRSVEQRLGDVASFEKPRVCGRISSHLTVAIGRHSPRSTRAGYSQASRRAPASSPQSHR